MAYRRRSYGTRRRSYSGRSSFRSRRSYGRRGTYRRRRRSVGGGRAQRVIVQVIGGPSGVAVSPVSIGMKAARPVRSRF